MVLKFEEFINEGILSKTINRSKTDTKRLGDINEDDFTTEEEQDIYDLLSEWCTGGQLNITKGLGEPRHHFKGDWEQFQTQLLDELSDYCQPVRRKIDVERALEDGYGVIYVCKNSLGVENAINMVGFVDGKQTKFYTEYFREDNVKVILTNIYQEGKIHVQISEDRFNGIYKGYKIPIKPFIKMVKQNKKCQNF